MRTHYAVPMALCALLLTGSTFGQTPAELDVLTGTQLAAGLDLGINTSGGLTNWLSQEPPPPDPGDLKMVCPANQAWCAMFITFGKPVDPPRPGLDLSQYQSMELEIMGDANTTIAIGMKDLTQADDGSETKVTLPVTANWTKSTIQLSQFKRVIFTKVYVLCEFVFNGGPVAQTVRVRRIRLLAAPPPVPVIKPAGIVPVYSAATTIEPGSWISIYGTNLASATTQWNGDFPTSLGGTSVTINGKPAYLWFVSPGQINLQAPDDTATGSANAVVTTSAGSGTSAVTLGQFGPSFSLLDSKHVAGIIPRKDGSGAFGGGTYDIVGPAGTSLGYKTVPAKAGDTIELFGVGFGPTNPPVPAGKGYAGSAPAANPVLFQINGQTVVPAYSGMTSAGLFQFNLTLPAGIGGGDVSIQATVGGVQTSAGPVISLQ